jgi:hypothetical protein
MEYTLKNGVKLQAIHGIEGADGSLHFRLGAQEHECKSIEVVMESGQMSGVPWARCEANNGRIFHVNLANIEFVEYVI